mmetsp:Transcript_9751/g.20814  ORF Transcript_9751/g.20814 Transcript_9751/m.20814 type:complete len:82 (-) Transcript_9751:108-353(-)
MKCDKKESTKPACTVTPPGSWPNPDITLPYGVVSTKKHSAATDARVCSYLSHNPRGDGMQGMNMCEVGPLAGCSSSYGRPS